MLTIFASDGAAYRVKTSKEILIERGAARYRLSAPQRFSAAGEKVEFSYASEQPTPLKPSSYQWIRLEDRATDSGPVADGRFALTFERPGTYSVELRDDKGQLLGATGHSVSGEGVKSVPGTVEVVFDKPEYRTGEEASALITFPEPVEDALLSLERDKVEATALLSKGADWLRLEKLNPTQYRVWIPVREEFSPNLTFSVLYTKGGDYSFQNAGIKVGMPQVEIDIATDKERYEPGETVTVTLATRFAGKPVSSHLTVSVVDEMVYALQAEIAPASTSSSTIRGATTCAPAPAWPSSATTWRCPAAPAHPDGRTAASAASRYWSGRAARTSTPPPGSRSWSPTPRARPASASACPTR